MNTLTPCPCGKPAAFAVCCSPLLEGQRQAETAEELMRARYTAHTKVFLPFLVATVHPDTRTELDPAALEIWCLSVSWQSLVIESSQAGRSQDSEGRVSFRARFRERGLLMEHYEHSLFLKEANVWYFLRGDASIKPVPTPVTPGRNAPCLCGSGKKWKKCCGRQSP